MLLAGQIGALLRREGLYPSLLATWRKDRAAGITQAMSPQKRGPKSKQSPLATENAKLQRENLRLTDRRGIELMGVLTEISPLAGTVAACEALNLSRASFYRSRLPRISTPRSLPGGYPRG